jgi:hypothetical protein
MSDHELIAQLKRIRYDLTGLQAKVSGALELAARLPLADPDRRECPSCGLSLASPAQLAEHVYLQHGGPDPDHWLQAERQAQ